MRVDEEFTELEIDLESIEPVTYEPLPGYDAVYPLPTPDALQPTIERVAAGVHHVTVRTMRPVVYTENDEVYSTVDVTVLTPADRVPVVVVRVLIQHIGLWEGQLLHRWWRLFAYDAARDVFSEISRDAFEALGYHLIIEAEVNA